MRLLCTIATENVIHAMVVSWDHFKTKYFQNYVWCEIMANKKRNFTIVGIVYRSSISTEENEANLNSILANVNNCIYKVLEHLRNI